MSEYQPPPIELHSPAWVTVTKLQFVLAASAVAVGLWNVPVDNWIKAYFVMANLLLLSSAVTLTKTLRDLHEGGRIASKVESAKLERILTRDDPVAV